MTVLQDIYGPDWPHGWVEVPIGGVPVRLTNLVDPTDLDAPETPSQAGSREYTTKMHAITFQGFRPGVAHGLRNNQGNVYIIRKGGTRTDYGTIVAVIAPGATVTISANSFRENNVFSLYRYYVDATNNNDGVLVTGKVF